MSALKRDAIIFFKVLIYLAIGFILTENVLGVIYEKFGISFMGNVWVNWFGLSYLLYFFYTTIRVLFTNENNQLFKKTYEIQGFLGTFYCLGLCRLYSFY